MIQIQRLEGFYWVARTEGYARAARAFPYPITQPGVHQQVRRLEAELGVTLFERVGKDRVVLTPGGRALYAFVAPFLEALPEVVRTLKTGDFAGTLKVHAAGLVLRYVLPPWLRRLGAKRPDIEIALTEMKSADLGLLRTGEADLLVDYFPEEPDDIAFQPVAMAQTWLVLPSNHRLARKPRLKLASLTGDTFIAYNADRKLRTAQLGVLERHGIRPSQVHSADSAETILGFVAAGLGFSIVPWLVAGGPKFPGVSAHAISLPGSRVPIHAAWKKRGPDNPFVTAALDLAPREGFDKLTPNGKRRSA